MLQAGPITRVYTGGGRAPHIGSHEGFVLRMPPQELPQWQTLGDKGDLQDIRRPAHAIRVWEPRERRYVPIDPTLDGAPTSEAATDEWYVGVVRQLAASDYIGPGLLRALVSSVKTASMEKLALGAFDEAFEGAFSNRWTELALGALQGEFRTEREEGDE